MEQSLSKNRMTKLRKIPSDEAKLESISALYMLVFNSEESLAPLSLELFHLLGEILGNTLPKNLHKSSFLRELSIDN
jgi:hypothetical protein